MDGSTAVSAPAPPLERPPLSSSATNQSVSEPGAAEEKKSTTPPPAQSQPPGLGRPPAASLDQPRGSSPPALAPAPATHSEPPPDQASASREPSEADTVEGDAEDPVQQPPLSPYGYAAAPRHVRPYARETPPPSPGDARETVRCPQALVGRLIGKGGDTIKDLQRRSGARIQIDQNYPEGQPRLVTVEGAAQCVRAGVELVRSLIGNSPAVGNGAPGRLATFECPKGLVGRVIGKGGETINELQRRSGARIQIEQRVAEGEPCVVEVQGDDRAVEEARRLVHEVMGGKRLDPPYVAYAYAAMAQQGYGFPPQPNVGLASYGQVRRAHAGSFSSASDTPPGSPIPGYAVPHYPYPYYPPYGFPPAQYGPPPPGSPLPGSPARGWTQHVDANTGRPYWHHPQLGASWSPPPAGPPPRPMPGPPPPQTNGDDGGDDAAPPAPAPAPNPTAWPHSAWASGAGGAADGDNP